MPTFPWTITLCWKSNALCYDMPPFISQNNSPIFMGRFESRHEHEGVTIAIVVALCLCCVPVLAQEKPETEGLLTVRNGMLPIILSAPHGGRQPIPTASERRGVDVAQFATGRDNYTDELTEKIGNELEKRAGAKPFAVIARFERKYLDVNRPVEGAYESNAAKVYYEAYHHALNQACRSVREGWGRGLLLDIHGQGAELETIYRGTDNGRTVASLLGRFGGEALTGPGSIFGHLERKGYRVSPPVKSTAKEGRYVGGFIVQTYGSHRGTGVDAIQMEFGTSLRNRRSLERMAADVAEAIVVFAKEYLPLSRSRAEWRPVIQP